MKPSALPGHEELQTAPLTQVRRALEREPEEVRRRRAKGRAKVLALLQE